MFLLSGSHKIMRDFPECLLMKSRGAGAFFFVGARFRGDGCNTWLVLFPTPTAWNSSRALMSKSKSTGSASGRAAVHVDISLVQFFRTDGSMLVNIAGLRC